MKKVLIGLMVLGLIIGGGVFVSNNNKDDEMHNDMVENEMNDDMATDDMNADMEDDMDKDDMTESNMEDDTMMTNDGDMAPMFDLKDLDGNSVSLASFEGEKVYVKFWASWCSICLGGLEELDNLTIEETDFKVITIVSPDYNGEKNSEKFMSWFENQDHDNLIVLLDVDGTFTREFGVRGYPTSAFIGSDNVLVNLFPGHLDNDFIKSTFETIN